MFALGLGTYEAPSFSMEWLFLLTARLDGIVSPDCDAIFTSFCVYVFPLFLFVFVLGVLLDPLVDTELEEDDFSRFELPDNATPAPKTTTPNINNPGTTRPVGSTFIAGFAFA